MTVTYDDERHAYTVNGKRVPSVTEITGILTADKYSGGNDAVLAQAQRRGTEVHELCEQIDCGIPVEEMEIAPELVGYVQAYINFLQDWNPEWDYLEKIVYTDSFAGRADRIGRIDGKTVIADIKTTASMDRLSKLALAAQLYGYAVAWCDMDPGHTAQRLFGIQLKKDGKYTLHEYSKIMDSYYDSSLGMALTWAELSAIARLIGGYQ